MSAPEVICFGSSMIDLTTYTPAFPRPGETLGGGEFAQSFGGKGANQAVQCARLGVSTGIVTCIGNDTLGATYAKQMSTEGLWTPPKELLHTSNGAATGVASILVETVGGQNSIVIAPGANNSISVDTLSSYFTDHAASTRVMLTQSEVPHEETLKALQLLDAPELKHIISIYNNAPAISEAASLAVHADIVCVNESELAVLLAGLPSDNPLTIEAIDTLLAKGAYDELAKHALQCAAPIFAGRCRAIVVTLGKDGVLIVRPDSPAKHITTAVVQAVDSVGAGDSFIGCLSANLARGVRLAEAATRACRCASASVLRRGAQTSYIYSTDLEDGDQIPSLDSSPSPFCLREHVFSL